jgi:hypothetical protein
MIHVLANVATQRTKVSETMAVKMNTSEKVNEANDPGNEPLSKREPAAPFGLVGLLYMSFLVMAGLLVGAYYFFIG